MNHEETLAAIKLRSDIAKLGVDQETRDRLMAGVAVPKSIPWDLVSETIKAREEAVFQSDLLDNIIEYYRKAVLLAEFKLAEAMELKDSLTEHTETNELETWGER